MTNKMKKINYIFYLFLAIGFFSCTEPDDAIPELKPKTGASVINYIRPTNPNAADSLLVGAFLGDLIAIVGDNLHDAKELWFNDQKSILTPNYITKNTIIVNVPTSVPIKVTNEISIKFADGTELKHPFKINIPGPVAENMVCEFVNEGSEAVINGDFFFTPSTVTFAGGAVGEVVKLTKNQLVVKVPAGAKPGPIAIKTNFGAANTKFWFRDNRGTILNFDEFKGGGWRSGKIFTDKAIDRNYAKLTVGGSGKLSSAWQWSDDNLEVDLWGQSAGRPEGPLFKGDPKDMVIKFEARVNNPWHGGWMQLIFSPWGNNNNALHSSGSHARGHWAPWDPAFDGIGTPFKTDGWITASVPLSEFIYNDMRTNSSLSLKYPDQFGSLSIFVRGPLGAECVPDIDIDNFRVVPK
jgi:hypothetical protein